MARTIFEETTEKLSNFRPDFDAANFDELAERNMEKRLKFLDELEQKGISKHDTFELDILAIDSAALHSQIGFRNGFAAGIRLVIESLVRSSE